MDQSTQILVIGGDPAGSTATTLPTKISLFIGGHLDYASAAPQEGLPFLAGAKSHTTWL
ncbi:MAG: hypothetical protein ACRDRW_12325 [Pseudonocardiaceae bacterium]